MIFSSDVLMYADTSSSQEISAEEALFILKKEALPVKELPGLEKLSGAVFL